MRQGKLRKKGEKIPYKSSEENQGSGKPRIGPRPSWAVRWSGRAVNVGSRALGSSFGDDVVGTREEDGKAYHARYVAVTVSLGK